jgi:hypothetical protein
MTTPIEAAVHELKNLFYELEKVEAEDRQLLKQSQELKRKRGLNNKIMDCISSRIRELNDYIEDCKLRMLSKEERKAITIGMQNDDFDKLTNQVVQFKSKYTNWVLVSVEYNPDTLYYEFTYKTPFGDQVTYIGN